LSDNNYFFADKRQFFLDEGYFSATLEVDLDKFYLDQRGRKLHGQAAMAEI
jgi:hypothetical protein